MERQGLIGTRSLAIGAVVASAMLAACGRPTEMYVRPEQVTDFKMLYDTNCSACHGIDGRHGVAQPLNDPVYLALVGDARLIEVISKGSRGTPMTGFAAEAGGTLTKEQVRALVDGMRRTWADPQRLVGVSMPAYSEDEAIARGAQPGDRDRGRTAYEAHCGRCHGHDGRGGARAGSVVDEAFLALTSDQQLRTTVIAGRADEDIPGWRDYVPGQPMTDQQVSDVVAWLASHRGSYD